MSTAVGNAVLKISFLLGIIGNIPTSSKSLGNCLGSRLGRIVIGVGMKLEKVVTIAFGSSDSHEHIVIMCKDKKLCEFLATFFATALERLSALFDLEDIALKKYRNNAVELRIPKVLIERLGEFALQFVKGARYGEEEGFEESFFEGEDS